MTDREKYEIVQRIRALPVLEQLEIIEDLVRNLSMAHTDHEAMAREMEEMANDPAMQRVLNNEDLVKADGSPVW
jgi:hypothetical protein